MEVQQLMQRNMESSMKNNLVVKSIETALVNIKPEYKTMLANINSTMPDIQKTSSNFYKSHSQFMNVTLDVTAITPIRSIKHSLAEIEHAKNALQEAHFRIEKQKIKLKKKQRKLKNCKDSLDKELLQVQILEIQTGLFNQQNYLEGAIRKMNFFTNQYKNLLKHLGVDEITEEMYEREENRYHIMTNLKQALNAARTRGGLIDEGNQIYLFDLGINGADAQVEVFNYLKKENEMIARGEMPTHEMTMQWLEACADKFEKCSQTFTERRGFKILDEQSLTNTPRLTSVA